MANKFWLGTGNWDGTTTSTANWGTASGGGTTPTNGPGVNDAAIFDGASGGGTCTVTGTIAIQAITCGAFTGTLNFNNNNVTLTGANSFNGSGSGTRTITLGSGTFTLSLATAAGTPWNMTTTTGLTFSGASSTIDFTGTVAAGAAQNFNGGGLTYGTVKVSGARFNSGLLITNSAGTIGTLTNTAAAAITAAASMTVTTLTQSAQLTLSVATGSTLTLTNAPTITGTLSAPCSILNGSTLANGATATVSVASGTMSGTYCAIEGCTFSGGATFTFTNSYDLGKNTGATITAPSAAGGIIYRSDLTGGASG